jgi:hypothetical protein
MAQQSTQDLAAAVQNPVAALISVPFQNNSYFDLGPNHNETANILNIQPVIPFTVGNWNIISRTIAPLVYVPAISLSLGDTITGNPVSKTIGETFGLGDINETVFFSPAGPGAFIWGIGPSMTVPTATSNITGSGKLSLGPSAVGLVQPKPWTIGALVRQQWSIAGPDGRSDVNQTLVQPFVSYNLPKGWNITTGPIITANWVAPSSRRWTVPVGGGFGRVFKISSQPLSASLQAYYYAERANFAPRWSLRVQISFLFPK